MSPRRTIAITASASFLAPLNSTMIAVALPNAIKAAVGQEHGLLLVTVEDEGPAAQSGLTIGDIVIGIAAQPVQSLDDLRASLTPERIGQAIAIRILRGGQPQELAVTPGEAKN